MCNENKACVVRVMSDLSEAVGCRLSVGKIEDVEVPVIRAQAGLLGMLHIEPVFDLTVYRVQCWVAVPAGRWTPCQTFAVGETLEHMVDKLIRVQGRLDSIVDLAWSLPEMARDIAAVRAEKDAAHRQLSALFTRPGATPPAAGEA